MDPTPEARRRLSKLFNHGACRESDVSIGTGDPQLRVLLHAGGPSVEDLYRAFCELQELGHVPRPKWRSGRKVVPVDPVLAFNPWQGRWTHPCLLG